MQELFLGKEKVSLLERCPHFRDVLISGLCFQRGVSLCFMNVCTYKGDSLISNCALNRCLSFIQVASENGQEGEGEVQDYKEQHLQRWKTIRSRCCTHNYHIELLIA